MFAPDGKERKGYGKMLVARKGEVRGDLTFALNDPAGVWKMVVRDVATGVEGAAQVKMLP